MSDHDERYNGCQAPRRDSCTNALLRHMVGAILLLGGAGRRDAITSVVGKRADVCVCRLLPKQPLHATDLCQWIEGLFSYQRQHTMVEGGATPSCDTEEKMCFIFPRHEGMPRASAPEVRSLDPLQGVHDR